MACRRGAVCNVWCGNGSWTETRLRLDVVCLSKDTVFLSHSEAMTDADSSVAWCSASQCSCLSNLPKNTMDQTDDMRSWRLDYLLSLSNRLSVNANASSLPRSLSELGLRIRRSNVQWLSLNHMFQLHRLAQHIVCS